VTRQDALKGWIAKALDLGERACALYTLAPSDYVIGAPMASLLLSRMAAIMVRNGAGFSELEQCIGEPAQQSRVGTGIHLGSYIVDGMNRPVFLASIDSFHEPPRATDPSVASSIFLEPLPLAPAIPLTFGRLAAIHLGLCRLLARTSSDLAPLTDEADFFAHSRPHPLAERALALARWAEQQRVAKPADWEALVRGRAAAAAAEQERERAAAGPPPVVKGGRGLPKRLLDRPRKRPLREIWHRIFRRLSGRYDLLDYPFLVRAKQVLVVERRTRTVLLRLPLGLDRIMRPGHELRAKSGIAYQPTGALFVDTEAVDELAERIFAEMSKLRPDFAGARP
jgi:hypothetical protein